MAQTSKKKFDQGGPSTLTSGIYESLRSDILEGTLVPGQKLVIDLLRVRYQVGGSPLREALNRLSAVGLVEQSDQRGFRVAPITIEGMRELAKTRCWINEIAMRESILNGDSTWEEQVVIAYHRLSRHKYKPDGSKPDRALELLHRQFHSALIAACPSPWLRDIHERLFDHADRLLFIASHTRDEGRDVNNEHRAIMEAVVNRDIARANSLMNEHIMMTAKLAEGVCAALLAAAERDQARSQGNESARPAA